MENNQSEKKQAAPAQTAKKTAQAAQKAGEGQAAKKTAPAAKKQTPSAEKSASKKPAAAVKPAQTAQKKKKKRLNKRQARTLRSIRNACIAVFGCLLALLIFSRMTCVFIGGQMYSLSEDRIDLRNKGVSDARPIARLTGLTEALLSGNNLTDVSPLTSLTDCRYMDLTGNPVTAESYAQLKQALPGCLILCEAEDNTISTLSLGGVDLPDADALARVFTSHKALTTVDLRGSDLPRAAVDSLCAQFPHISILYSAGSAGTLVVKADHAAEAADLLGGVPPTAHVTVTGCAFTPDEYRAVRTQFPALSIDCMVTMGGKAMLLTETEISLPGAALDAQLEADLRLFPALDRLTIGEALPAEAARLKSELTLSEINYSCWGYPISPETLEMDLTDAAHVDAKQLQALLEALPTVRRIALGATDEQMISVIDAHKDRTYFIRQTEAFGQQLSTGDRSVDFGGLISDENIGELTDLLAQMPDLEEALMYDSELSAENMEMLADRFPDVFFGWTYRICNGKYKIRTDITAFSTQLGSPRYKFTEEDFLPLRYCKNLQALDLGHNAISDISFLTNFPKMKVLILADNKISDISPLAELKELEYVELFMLYDLHDYSPLTELEHLIDLNIRCEMNKRHTINVSDFMEMKSLKRLWISSGHLTDEEEELLREALPDCKISITETHATGNAWRRHERHEVVERMFEKRKYEPFE